MFKFFMAFTSSLLVYVGLVNKENAIPLIAKYWIPIFKDFKSYVPCKPQ